MKTENWERTLYLVRFSSGFALIQVLETIQTAFRLLSLWDAVMYTREFAVQDD